MSNAPDNECGIEISTRTKYLELQSEPAKNSYAFSYTITILNHRDEPVRLLNRHWVITDQNNKVEEVNGKGVVGQQPVIQPGESFEYSSGTIIGSEIGDMRGSYTMETANGTQFEAPIPLFVLAIPNMIH
ncbi:MAG: Co2+/Mg2+ efflux protein ApaG [Gammaproteobacteria bacterium]|nr:Co2+/Mg2+ efflux protein ApaG [Gammaproteobacteria bacterium]